MSSLIESWLLDNNFWKTDQVSWCAPIKMTQKPWNPGARIIITTNLFTSQLAYFSAGSVLFQSLLILEKYPFCPRACVILLLFISLLGHNLFADVRQWKNIRFFFFKHFLLIIFINLFSSFEKLPQESIICTFLSQI